MYIQKVVGGGGKLKRTFANERGEGSNENVRTQKKKSLGGRRYKKGEKLVKNGVLK